MPRRRASFAFFLAEMPRRRASFAFFLAEMPRRRASLAFFLVEMPVDERRWRFSLRKYSVDERRSRFSLRKCPSTSIDGILEAPQSKDTIGQAARQRLCQHSKLYGHGLFRLRETQVRRTHTNHYRAIFSATNRVLKQAFQGIR